MGWQLEVVRKEGLNYAGRAIVRTAVRAVITRGVDRSVIAMSDELLMIHSAINGDYKFPGGGVDPGETLEAALRRELLEETGAHLTGVPVEIGRALEYDRPVETDFELFNMTSIYYTCTIGDSFDAPRLDGYEADLGFAPVWVRLAEALRVNRALLSVGGDDEPRWTRREVMVLERLRQDGIARPR